MNIDKRLVRTDSLEKLFDILKQNSKNIFAPVSKNGKISFKAVRSFRDITTDYIQTTQSSKDIVFPRTEKILDYSKNKGVIDVKPSDYQSMPETIVWGVRPCDAMGISKLSAIFNWDLKDEIYNLRSLRTTVLGFSCSKADEFCFCASMGGNPGNVTGSDILFTRMGDNGDYLAEILTEKGSDIVNMAPDLFGKADRWEKERYLA